jgi:uncharacterized membrane protein (UPF0127 family)
MQHVSIMNTAKGMLVGDRIRVANTSIARAVGLLRDTGLEPGEGLWIKPSSGIHTIGMKFAIDVVGLDRKMNIVRLWRDVKPYRLTSIVWKLGSVIEMQSGAIDRLGLTLGDSLAVMDHSADQQMPTLSVN